jgi:hypothetical protein
MGALAAKGIPNGQKSVIWVLGWAGGQCLRKSYSAVPLPAVPQNVTFAAVFVFQFKKTHFLRRCFVKHHSHS